MTFPNQHPAKGVGGFQLRIHSSSLSDQRSEDTTNG